METTLLKGYVVFELKTNIASTENQFGLVKILGFNYPTIEQAEASIPTSGYETYTILPVYRRIKTEAK
jgi:hypothetical protein